MGSNQVVGAAWFQFRIGLRSSWRAWVALGLLAGVASGIAMVAVAGARRTDSSLHRVVVDHAAADVQLNPNNGNLSPAQWRRIEHLPEVADYSYVEGAPMVTLKPNGQPDIAFLESARGAVVLSNPDGYEFRRIDRPGIVAGELPGPNATDALVINETAAAALHLHVGSDLRVGFFNAAAAESGGIPKLQRRTLEVAAIVRTLNDATRARDDPRLAPTMVLSRSLSRTNRTARRPSTRVRRFGCTIRAGWPRSSRRHGGSPGPNVLDLQELSGTLARGASCRPSVCARAVVLRRAGVARRCRRRPPDRDASAAAGFRTSPDTPRARLDVRRPPAGRDVARAC